MSLAAPSFPVGVVDAGPGTWGRRTWGSGFLVDDCHLMTARHVVGGQGVGRRIRFRIEPWEDSTSSNTSLATVVAAGDWRKGSADVSGDWALARLDRCLGAAFGTLPIAVSGLYWQGSSPSLKPRLIGAGYPVDRGTMRLTIDPSCEARLRTTSGLQHDCASLPGNSGGPLIIWNDTLRRHEVVGMTVGDIPTRRATAYDPHRPNLAVDLMLLRERIGAVIARGISSRDRAAEFRSLTNSKSLSGPG